MQAKTITETSRSFYVIIDAKGEERQIRVTRKLEGRDSPVWQMVAIDGNVVEQSVKDFLVDVINGYIKTGKILEGRREAAYTQSEFREWICPHCGKINTTKKVEQGYPLPLCQKCEEQSDWGNEGG